MNNDSDMRKAYFQAFARADNDALTACHTFGLIEMANAGQKTNWGDVGTLNNIAEILEGGLDMAVQYLKAVENRKENAG